jgi:hypothetical protein
MELRPIARLELRPIKCHFDGLNPVDEKFTTTNIYTGEPLIFMVDPSVSFCPLF